MIEQLTRSLEEMIDDDDLMTAAIRQGVREELLSQARAGNSVCVSKDGKVVWLTPDEIFKELGYIPSAQTKAS